MSQLTAIVAGGGPAGLAAACLLAREGVATTLVAPSSGPDPRTVALMRPTLQMLEYLGVWPNQLQTVSAPLKRQRIVDDTGSLISAPDVSFDAREIGVDAFAWNIPLVNLVPALRAEAESAGVTIYDDIVTDAITQAQAISIKTKSGRSLTAQVAIAADGATSILRGKAGIGTDSWSYDQSALVTTFNHSGEHGFASCEYYKRSGPCTVVPLPGRRSAVVWMDRPDATAKRAELSDQELATEIQIATHGELGLISGLSPRKVFPMRGLTAKSFAAGRTILIGETAHVVPPIGAQGLNMSFRDAALAVDLILAGQDAGDPKVIESYARQRKSEVVPRQQLINAMNRSLLLELLPLDLGRAASLWAVYGLGPLREQVLKYGLGVAGKLPFAMRERASPIPA